jgi:hypothetical protein
VAKTENPRMGVQTDDKPDSCPERVEVDKEKSGKSIY